MPLPGSDFICKLPPIRRARSSIPKMPSFPSLAKSPVNLGAEKPLPSSQGTHCWGSSCQTMACKYMFSKPQLQTQQAGYIDTETKALISVSARARDDTKFLTKLVDNPNQALKAYNLTPEAKAALGSGDIRWLESRVGTLDEPLRTWLTSRLTQEKW